MEKGKVTREIIEHVERLGKIYEPALLPAGVTRGRMGRCFDNALMAAIRGKLRYVEGLAMPLTPGTKHYEKWILHAWVTDGYHAYDPTWYAIDGKGNEVPLAMTYFGIEMDLKTVAEFVKKTEYAGVLPNAWRAPHIADELLPV